MKVFNAYAPFFRVNSVFWDPSVYGRYLTVAILASLAGILLGGVRGWRMAGLYAVVIATWLGLLISFSQSSFVALAAGIVVAVAVAWGRRATARARRARRRHDRRAARGATGAARARRQVAIRRQPHHVRPGEPRRPGPPHHARPPDHRRRRGRLLARVRSAGSGSPGKDPKRVASHTMPVTVAAELGVVGLALLAWLARRRAARDAARARPGVHVARRARHRRRPRRDRASTACSTQRSSRIP